MSVGKTNNTRSADDDLIERLRDATRGWPDYGMDRTEAASRITALEAQVAALTAQYRPSMTDLMTDPETMPDMDEMEYDHRSGDENAND